MTNQPADVAITVPTGFEVRVGSGTYGPTGSIPASTTSITVEVRLSGQVPGSSSGFVRFTHGGGTASYNVSGNTTSTNAVALSASPTILTSFSTSQGTPSNVQVYTLTGCNLSTPVVITPPTGYAVSTDGSNFSPTPLSVALGQAGQSIFVRLTGDAAGSFGGSIDNQTTGASTTVSVSGQVSAPPIAAPDLQTQSGQGYPGGVSALTVTQNQYASVVFTATNCAGVLSWTGSNGSTGTGDIAVPTNTTGMFTYTAVCTLLGQSGPPASATLIVQPAANRPPSATSIPDQTAVVGQIFSYTIPNNTFTDPDGQTLTLTASGLPAGTIFSGNSISGTPSQTGVNSVTVVATDPGGLSVSASFLITVVPQSTTSPQPLQLIAPTYNCLTGVFQFNTIGGDSTPISFSAIGITGPRVSNIASLVDDVDTQLAEEIRNGRPNVAPIRLSATQSGVSVTYLWDAVATCTSSSTVTPPPTSTTAACGSPAETLGQSLQMVAPTYNCQTGDIQFKTTGGNGSAITYLAIGIVSETTNCIDRMDNEVAMDVQNDSPNVQPFTLIARQGSQSSTFSWDARAYCRTTAPARRAGTMSDSDLQITVLNNPTDREQVEVLITGASDTQLQLSVTDAAGRVVSRQVIGLAKAKEHQLLHIGSAPGMYFLKALTPTGSQTVRILKK
ncbi:putative Ig domain-containing protein [Rudanella paleaurantiibacter]|nr:putative Ig domain-containing protein [Rudanella paleaurantiibacter]